MNRDNIEYFLEDVVDAATHMPRAYFLPTDRDISRLCVGNIVYVIFLLSGNPKIARTQKVTVELTRINSNRLFSGVIISDSPFNSPAKGDIIRFKKENIAGIYNSNTDCNVRISNRALEMRQVNVAVRSSEQDIGWYLYLDDEYSDSTLPMNIRPFDEILDFEPRLEKLLSVKNGRVFGYSADDLDFVEISSA